MPPALVRTAVLLALSNAVFAPFALICMKQQLRLDRPWAAPCLVGAAYFAFRFPELT